MGFKNKSVFWYLIPLVLLLYSIHKAAFRFLDLSDSDFYYSLESTYLFFTIASAIILFILVKVKQKNFDTTGLVFLWITTVKMILSYAAVRPFLHWHTPNSTIEKINFFVLFIVFLAIETGVTICFLNEKK